MNKVDYSLKNLINQYGGYRRIFESVDFIIAAICAFAFFIYIRSFSVVDASYIAASLAEDLLDVSASLFGILFAAFAIILSLSDRKFIVFLRKYDVFNKILFVFWQVSMLYIVDIFLNILIKFCPAHVVTYPMTASVLIFFWALVGTIDLVNETIGFGRRRADYLEYEKEIEQLSSSKQRKE